MAGTELGADRTPRWWALVRGLQGLLLAVALVGALWLLLLVGLGALQLGDVVPLPEVAGLPLPTLLLVAGLLPGLLLGVLCRPLVRADRAAKGGAGPRPAAGAGRRGRGRGAAGAARGDARGPRGVL